MKRKILIAGVGIIFLGGLILAARPKSSSSASEAGEKSVIILNENNFQSELKNRVVLVDFWASWCPPCRMMEPVIEQVATGSKGFAYVGKVNVDENQSLAMKYQVQNIPTTIIFKNGKEVKRFVGVNSKEFLIQQMKEAK
jgi:thioredoxin 1